MFEYFEKEGVNKKLYNQIMNKKYVPFFMKSFDLIKKDKVREISILEDIDKKIQTAISNYLYDLFEECFSEFSFGFMKNKSIFDALNLAVKYSSLKLNIIKTDIKDFFDNINHTILTKILEQRVDDKILFLILIYIKNRKIKNGKIIKTLKGLPQGNVISPVLSNIYFSPIDKFLEKEVKFVRFADDLVLFVKDTSFLDKFKRILSFFDLQINENKTYITTKSFVFLNCRIKDNTFYLDNERFNELISKLAFIFKNFNIEKFNNFLNSIESYYKKVLNTKQKEILFNEIEKRLIHFLALKRYKNEFKNKNEILEFLENIKFEIDINKIYDELNKIREKEIEKILNKAQKREIYKNLSFIFADKIGMRIGINKNKITLKYKNKLLNTYNLNNVKEIFIFSKGVSISSDLIYKCSKYAIKISFFKNNEEYASFIPNNSTIYFNTLAQLKAYEKKRIYFAKQFIKGKIKNQLNYIKYINKYHKNFELEIKKIENLLTKLKKVDNIENLFILEAQVAEIYWNVIKKYLDYPFEKRIHQGATDLVNSSLNYGYAILYSLIKKLIIKVGLNPYISFLHSIDSKEFTLSFDVIEEYRSFVVDRTIFAMINKNEPLTIKNGYLTKSTKELITKNIYERLLTPTKYKNEKVTVENIILAQLYLLKKAITENKPYKPFIGRY
jgi:CRISPR-associated endonuclease Cas1